MLTMVDRTTKCNAKVYRSKELKPPNLIKMKATDKCYNAISSLVTKDNHSNDNIEYVKELIDLDRCKLCRYDLERRSQKDVELHKKEDVYGKEPILKRVEVDVYGSARKAANLKFKCARDQEWVALRTMVVRIRSIVVMVLLVSLLATGTGASAPVRSRPTRSTNQEKSVRSYLQNFGYLKKGQPEVENLLMGDVSQSYEDEFRIAIKHLQEFGGIPVTGEIDEATTELLKKKRCGRPDNETGDDDNARRKKRFAIQGEKWKHTNLTWSLSSLRRPSLLEPYSTRNVLARALDVWEQASKLTFTEVNSDDADIVVSFVKRYHDDAYPFDGRGSILAHAFFPGSGRGGDAHFDDDELWLLQPSNDDEEGTSLFAVAAHEFGHSLGLSHSKEKGALMYPWYQGIQPNFVLPDDDRNGIQQMYGPKEKRQWGRIPNYPTVKTSPPTTTTTTTTTTTKRPHYHHHNRHDKHPTHQHPSKYPVFYPQKPTYPDRPSYPEKPSYPERPNYPDRHHPEKPVYPKYPNIPTYYPDRRHYYPTDEHPRQTTHNHYPRTETTTHRTTRHYQPPKPRPTTVKPTEPSDKPDTCDTSYDAVSLIRGELFIFKNRYHWRIGARGRYDGYPIEISRFWSGLPKDLTHVDAVYERPDRKIAFFVRKELYLFDSQYLVNGYPKPLVDLGLPSGLEKIDAAMIWGHNSKTYFYSGDRYWKYDEEVGRVEPDYPRDMSMWKGVGYNIDSVFQWKDGKTYFFKGKGFWKFNDLQMRVEHERQHPSASFWMGCPAERAGRRAAFHFPAAGSTLRSPSAASKHNNNLAVSISVILILFSYFRYYS